MASVTLDIRAACSFKERALRKLGSASAVQSIAILEREVLQHLCGSLALCTGSAIMF